MKKYLLVASLLLIASPVWAAGSCVFTKASPNQKYRVIRQWVCTANAEGAVSSPTITGSGYDELVYTGTIREVALIPGTGDDAPAAVTTCEILATDDSTRDFASGLFAGASTTDTTAAMPLDEVNGAPVEVNGKALTISATGLGDSNKITVRMISER